MQDESQQLTTVLSKENPAFLSAEVILECPTKKVLFDITESA